MNGWIKLHRQLLDSEIFAHPIGLKIWVWCLLKASQKKRFLPLKIGKGIITIEVGIGGFIFGRFKAEDELGIDGSTIYKWIKKFEEKEMINIKSNNQYSIITICNWECYQSNEEEKEQQRSSQVAAEEQQSSSSVAAEEHIQEGKESKKGKESKEGIKAVRKKFIAPTLIQVQDYFVENGYPKDLGTRAFKHYHVADWHDTNGKAVKNWQQKMNSVWFKPENKEVKKPKLFNDDDDSFIPTGKSI